MSPPSSVEIEDIPVALAARAKNACRDALDAVVAARDVFVNACTLSSYPIAREDMTVGSGLLLYNAVVAILIAETRGNLDSPFATVSFGMLASEIVFAIVYVRIRARRELTASYATLDP